MEARVACNCLFLNYLGGGGLGTRLCNRLCESFLSTFFPEYLFGIKSRSFGYSGQFKKRCLFIMNHVSHFDWMFFWAVVERQGDLMTWRAVTKDMLKNVPFIGES